MRSTFGMAASPFILWPWFYVPFSRCSRPFWPSLLCLAMPDTTVTPPSSDSKYLCHRSFKKRKKRNSNISQHHSHSIHDPGLCDLLISLCLLLPTLCLLWADRRLLRTFCYRLLFHVTLLLHRSGSPRPKGILPHHRSCQLAHADQLVSEMLLWEPWQRTVA